LQQNAEEKLFVFAQRLSGHEATTENHCLQTFAAGQVLRAREALHTSENAARPRRDSDHCWSPSDVVILVGTNRPGRALRIRMAYLR